MTGSPIRWAEFFPKHGRPDKASNRCPDERLIEAMVGRLICGSESERMSAAAAWDAWESTHVSLDPHWQPGPVRSDPVERANFATLVTHYWANDAFLRETSILSRMDLISHIPAVLIHGRHDISGPSIIPWRLHHRWPGSKLHIVESEGHGGPISMQLTCDATDSFLTNDGECR